MDHATEMGKRIRDRRKDAGLSLLDLTMELRQRLPRSHWVVDETLRRYERTLPEEKADVVLVAAIADVLGCQVKDLSPAVAEQLDDLRVLLSHGDSSWSSEMLNTDTVATESSRYADVA